MMQSLKKYRNILLIKPGAIGDLIQMTPVIRALHAAYPEASISLVVSSKLTASLFAFHPLIRQTIVYDRKGAHSSLAAFFRLWRDLHGKSYDLVINYQRSNLKAWLLATAAFPCRVLVYNKARGRIVHAVVNHLETLIPLGIAPTKEIRLEFEPGNEARQFAEQLFLQHGLAGHRVIALNAGASNRIKCWDPKQFAVLGELLAERLNARLILVGSQDERDLAETVCSRMSLAPLDLVGRTSLLQLGAILEKSDLLVSGDTGPLHLATAVKTPVVALFGAIDPRRTGPVGEGCVVIRHPEVSCVPCNAKNCKNERYLECMEMITAEEVFQAVAGLLCKLEGLP